MWVGGVVEYMSDSCVTILRVSVGWWCSGVHVRLLCYHTECQCWLVAWWSTCQTLVNGGVTILRVSLGWRCSGVRVRPLVLVVLP